MKALETLLLPTLTEHLPMSDHQHGFRKGRSTTTALYEIDCHITRGLNKGKPVDRTVLVGLDLRAAFVTVNINKLLNIILASKIPKYTKRWLCSYLRGRQTYVEFRNAKSTFRKVRAGVTQGGVPSCSTPTFLDCQHHLTASNSHRTRTTARHTRQGLLFPRFVRS